jgi:cell pole-organizing protein PopZ
MEKVDNVEVYEKEDGSFLAKSEEYLVEAEGADVADAIYKLSGELREFGKHAFDAIKDEM